VDSTQSNTLLRKPSDDSSGEETYAGEQLERRQLEMLLMHALKVSGGDFSYLVSATGTGVYAEQFVQLDAAAVRTASGEFRVGLESLNSRRADPSTQLVMRTGKVVHGSVLVHGLPLNFASESISVTHFVQLPVKSGSNDTSVLFVANPGISNSGTLQGGILGRLRELASVMSKRRQSKQASFRKNVSDSFNDESAFKLRRLKEELGHAVVTVNTAGVIRGINHSAEKLFGCDAGHALGMTLDRYMAPKIFISTLQLVESWNRDESAETMFPMSIRSVSILAEGGSTKQLSAAAYYLRDDYEKCVSFVLAEPMSDEATKVFCDDLNFRISSLSLGIVRLDADYQCEQVNDLWCQISGQSTFMSKELGWTDAIHAEDLMDLWLELGNIAEKRLPYSGTIRLHRIDGMVRQIAIGATCVPDEAGRANGFVLVFQDLTADYRARQQITHAIEHDALTGLANRSAFLDSLQRRLNNKHLRKKTTLLCIKVNELRAVNAMFGQHAGDDVLQQVSKRLVFCMGPDALGARLSGSKFSVTLTQTFDPFEICSIAQRIVRCIEERYWVFGSQVHVSATVGICIGDQNSITSDQMLEQASVALSAAKVSKLGDWKVYTKKLNDRGIEQLLLRERISSAVVNNEFSLEYQPQRCLESDQICSFDALLRWQPVDFPAPETQHLIQLLQSMDSFDEVGSWVLETACRQFAMWDEMGLLENHCTLSVNITAEQLTNSDFPAQIAAILADCRMSPARLNLDIAESALDENYLAAYHVADELKKMGVRLSLSAFGTGKASLSHLNRLPVDSLKIDRSFVMDIDWHDPSRSMAMSIIDMANKLDIDVVASGTESTDTLKSLRGAKCNFVQGVLVTTAGSAAFLEPMLVRQNYKPEDMLQLG